MAAIPTLPVSDMSLIDQLAAIEEIKQLKAAYARCVDTKDFGAWANLFTPDAIFDEREMAFARDQVTNEVIVPDNISLEVINSLAAQYKWPIVGREAIESFGKTISRGNITVHHMCTPEITLHTPHSASAVWPFEDYAWFPKDAPFSYMHGFGHYHETYQKLEDGRWYIKTLDLSRLKMEWR